MGNFLFKSDTLDFAVLPSEKIEGPLGLGFPDDDRLNNVEKETLIPALCMQHVRRNHCAKEWGELAECSKKWHWASVALCRKMFDDSMNCSKKILSDPEFQEEMRKRYLELRATYRSTGIEPKY
ncbi:unnamed protein product [Rodentolepis nana]|uniref:COX assembly mitochondrial protein n=1 Tax=Rodentolepis nana TaxID=102285 RepID=A0A0R3T6F5_RODNA|nr:unnamed protein product [Rodentolepis nana]